MTERIRYRKDKEGKRHRVVMYRGAEGYTARWTSHCTGCTETYEYEDAPERGSGCSECGYNGRVRMSMWVPFDKHPDVVDENQERREMDQIRERCRAEGLEVIPEEYLRPHREKWEKHWEMVRSA